ncbi:MAG: hypothetical protein ACE5LQ_04915 [Candidatus Bipolaricaulia bacterium]
MFRQTLYPTDFSDSARAALERHFPEEVHWTHPQGGLFLWATLPEGLDAQEILKIALEKGKVAFVPGGAFFPSEPESNTMRLNFSYSSPERIEEGIARLGRVLKSVLARSVSAAKR